MVQSRTALRRVACAGLCYAAVLACAPASDAAPGSSHATNVPVGVYLLDERPSDKLSQAIEGGHYDGVTIQVRWTDLQPAPGGANFATLDEPLQQVLRLGRKFAVGIQAGQWTPTWVFGAPYHVSYDQVTFSWGHGNKCTQAYIPRPWDPRLITAELQAWQQIAQHLAGIPGALDALTMVKVNGFNLANDQMRALSYAPRSASRGGCKPTDGVQLYQQAGYRPGAVLENWKTLARGVAGMFPRAAIAIDVIPAPEAWPPIDDQGNIYDPLSNRSEDLTDRIVFAALSMFPGKVYPQANTLDFGDIPEPMSRYVAAGGRLGLQTNAHARGSANCGVRRQMVACTNEGIGGLMDHGASLGAWFIEVHPNDALMFPDALAAAGGRIRASKGM